MGYFKTLATLLICTLPSIGQAIQVQIGFNNPFVYIQIGHGQFSNLGLLGPPTSQVDEVSFDFPAGVQPGDGSAITGTPANIPIAVLAFSGRGRANFRVTIDSSIPLFNGTGDIIPFSKFSWTTRDGDISSGTFNDTANQLWQQYSFTHPRGRGVIDFMTFSFANDQIYRSGTYTGRVVYTITEL